MKDIGKANGRPKNGTQITRQAINRRFNELKQALGFIKPGKREIVYEHGHWCLIVEDNYYQVEEPESRRTFSVVLAQVNGLDTVDFEEV